MAMAVLSIAILVGLFLIFQHLEEEGTAAQTFANQKTLLENQNFLKQILEENEEHEDRELDKMTYLLHLFNTTGSNVTKQNSEKLDQILDILRLTKP